MKSTMHFLTLGASLTLILSGTYALPTTSDVPAVRKSVVDSEHATVGLGRHLPDTSNGATIRTLSTQMISSSDPRSKNEQMTMEELRPLMNSLSSDDSFASGGKAKKRLQKAKEQRQSTAASKIMRRAPTGKDESATEGSSINGNIEQKGEPQQTETDEHTSAPELQAHQAHQARKNRPSRGRFHGPRRPSTGDSNPTHSDRNIKKIPYTPPQAPAHPLGFSKEEVEERIRKAEKKKEEKLRKSQKSQAEIQKKLKWNREMNELRMLAKEWEEFGGVDMLPEEFKKND